VNLPTDKGYLDKNVIFVILFENEYVKDKILKSVIGKFPSFVGNNTVANRYG